MSNVRTRFAPSPTGEIHIGNVRTAIFCWLFARHEGGTFILRIEDTDKARSTDESVRSLVENLQWLGLDWDEGPEAGGGYGPYFQSQKSERYRELVDRLRAEGKAYRCYCTAEELEAERGAAQAEKRNYVYSGRCRDLDPDAVEADRRDRFVVRLRVPAQGAVVVEDLIRGRVEFDLSQYGDFIITKGDGGPVFHLANVIDDIDMGITHIIRGEDLFSSAPRQKLIFEALGAEPPVCAHIPLLMGPDGAKLSKRHGATALEHYRASGYLPQALFNFLALLGWNPGDDREIMTRDELIQAFTLDNVGKSKSIFDPDKLRWMNGKYLRELEPDEFFAAAVRELTGAGVVSEPESSQSPAWLREVVELYRERVGVFSDIVEQARYVFGDIGGYDEKAFEKFMMKDPVLAERLEEVAGRLDAVEWGLEALETLLREYMETNALKPKQFFQPIRIAVTGGVQSPGLFETLKVIGRERVVARLRAAATEIRRRRG